MRYDKRVGILLFAVLIVVALINELSITPLVISDSDFTTYIIVPLLMLPLFALFMLKEPMSPSVGRRDITVGICAFVALVAIILALRIYTSYLFVDMRIDMLLFPLMIASLAILLFGIKNLGRFNAIMVYALFASPALLIWLSAANSGFVVANTLLIFNILKVAFPHAAYTAPMTITVNSYSIGIGQTCVGIGVLIGTVMFLTPLAYLYDGRPSRKAMWVASGLGLMLLLNFLRMLGISLAWFFYGPSNYILTVHLFAGILLFYISIIAMVLLSGKYGLAFPASRRVKVPKIRSKQHYLLGILVAIAITIIYFILLSDYPNLQVPSPLSVYSYVPFNVSRMGGLVTSLENESQFNATAIQDYAANSLDIVFGNSTYSYNAPIAMLVTSSRLNYIPELLKNNTVLGRRIFFSNSSLTQSTYYLESNGHYFFLYAETRPYFYPNGTSTSVGVYAVVPANVTSTSITCDSYYNSLYTYIADVGSLSFSYNSTVAAKTMSAYCIVEKLVNR